MENNNIKIAVLSGKGGTGKTLVSVNLAAVAKTANYIDCDVEEPNGHLFFKPTNIQTEKVFREIPLVDDNSCIACQKCVEFCNFNALAYTNKLIIFKDICHSCGGCMLVCPKDALTKQNKFIGEIEKGKSENVNVFSGFLTTGEPSGTPIIDALLNNVAESEDITIIDSPPGSACIVMDSIKDVDYCVLVAEPTIFGVHNLNMVYELVTLFNKPFGVVLNKTLDGENPSKKFCIEKKINILEEIPFDNHLGTLNSNSIIVSRQEKKYRNLFSNLLNNITKEVKNERIVNP